MGFVTEFRVRTRFLQPFGDGVALEFGHKNRFETSTRAVRLLRCRRALFWQNTTKKADDLRAMALPLLLASLGDWAKLLQTSLAPTGLSSVNIALCAPGYRA